MRVICATYTPLRRHYELVVASGTGYKTHPITAVRQIKSLQERPLRDDEIESYTIAAQSWFDITFAKLNKEEILQAKSHVVPTAITHKSTTASPTETPKHRTREQIPRKAKDKMPQRYFFLFMCIAVFLLTFVL
jgi:hypothetical protein